MQKTNSTRYTVSFYFHNLVGEGTAREAFPTLHHVMGDALPTVGKLSMILSDIHRSGGISRKASNGNGQFTYYFTPEQAEALSKEPTGTIKRKPPKAVKEVKESTPQETSTLQTAIENLILDNLINAVTSPRVRKGIHAAVGYLVDTMSEDVMDQVIQSTTSRHPVIEPKSEEVNSLEDILSQVSWSSKSEDLENPGPTKEEPREKLKALVVGLLRQQQEVIQQAFEDEVDLKFWTEGNPGKDFQDMAKNVDFVVVSRFTDHKTFYALQKVNPRILKMVHGGLSQIKETINQILEAKPKQLETSHD